MANELKEEISVLTPHGDMESWSVVATGEDTGEWHLEVANSHGRVWTSSGEDLFEAFRVLREVPEAEGFRFLVAGARLDCAPTQMSGQMTGGVLLVTKYRSATLMVIKNLLSFFSVRFRYRYIFSSAAASRVGTVAEQDAYMEEWLSRALRR